MHGRKVFSAEMFEVSIWSRNDAPFQERCVGDCQITKQATNEYTTPCPLPLRPLNPNVRRPFSPHDPNFLREWARVNERYQELYQTTKDRLLAMPKGKQFDFSEAQIFGRSVTAVKPSEWKREIMSSPFSLT